MIFSGGSNAAVTSEAVARMCSAKKVGVLINFTKFTGKRLCQSLFFNKVAGLEHFFLQNTPMAASEVAH